MRKLILGAIFTIFALHGCASTYWGRVWEGTKRKVENLPPDARVWAPRLLKKDRPDYTTMRIEMALPSDSSLVRVFVNSASHELKTWDVEKDEVVNVWWSGSHSLIGIIAPWWHGGQSRHSYRNCRYDRLVTLYVVLYERCGKCQTIWLPSRFTTYVAKMAHCTQYEWQASTPLTPESPWRKINELPEGIRKKIAPKKNR